MQEELLTLTSVFCIPVSTWKNGSRKQAVAITLSRIAIGSLMSFGEGNYRVFKALQMQYDMQLIDSCDSLHKHASMVEGGLRDVTLARVLR